MSSQFAFLSVEFAEVYEHVARAENLAHADPRGATFYCRLALETAVTWLYRHDRTLKILTSRHLPPTSPSPLFEPSLARRFRPKRVSLRTPVTPPRTANRSPPCKLRRHCASSSTSRIG